MKTKLIGLTVLVLALATLQIAGQDGAKIQLDAWVAGFNAGKQVGDRTLISSALITNWADIPNGKQIAYLTSNRWATVVVEGVTNRFIISSTVMQTPVLMLREVPLPWTATNYIWTPTNWIATNYFIIPSR